VVGDKVLSLKIILIFGQSPYGEEINPVLLILIARVAPSLLIKIIPAEV